MSGGGGTGDLSSPACLMHEIDEKAHVRLESWDDIKAWRKERRDALIKQRLTHDTNKCRQRSEPILLQLAEDLRALRAARSADKAPSPFVLGIYWPFRGEIDVRELAHQHIAAGGMAALPVVSEKSAPVQFWRWRPEVPMARGLFNIPIPGECEIVTPDVLIIPLVGFDRAGFRLGYGGGYYDRTLAAANPRPHTIGIAFAEAELETTYPQAHDIPMDRIVTDRESLSPRTASES
jgi:5-formyltetrahydrofolate cyclo-ligase